MLVARRTPRSAISYRPPIRISSVNIYEANFRQKLSYNFQTLFGAHIGCAMNGAEGSEKFPPMRHGEARMMLIAKSKLEANKESVGVELVRAADEYGVIRVDCVEDLACNQMGVFEPLGGSPFASPVYNSVWSAQTGYQAFRFRPAKISM